MIALGALVGSRFANTTARMLVGYLGAALGSFAVSMAVAAFFIAIVAYFFSFPIANIVIAFSPGAQDTMMVLALALHLDPVYVGAHHLARFLVVTFSVAIAARRIAPQKPAPRNRNRLDKEAIDRKILRFRLVVFVLVQKPGDLSSQRRRIQELTHRSGGVEKLALQFCRQRVPLHDDGSAQAAKNTLFFGDEDDGFLFGRHLHHLVEFVRQPFFVVGKRAETILGILQFADLAWVVRPFDEIAVFLGLRAIFFSLNI